MTGKSIKRTYLVSVNNITGNPYEYTKASNQKVVFNIDWVNFIEIDKFIYSVIIFLIQVRKKNLMIFL